jgi:hypothetical protein
MANACKCCQHQERKSIDKALADGATTNLALATKYDLSVGSVRRHRAKCLTKAVVAAAERRSLTHADSLLSRLEALIADARRIGEAAVAAKKFGPAQSGIKNIVHILELVARLTGQLDNGTTNVNIALVNQQREAEQRFDRLSLDELRTFRALLAKMEADEVIEVEAVPAPVVPTAAGEKPE